MGDDKYIDLNKLTQRELLIMVHNDVKALKGDVKELKDDSIKTKIKVNTLETRSKLWGALMGFLSGLGISWMTK